MARVNNNIINKEGVVSYYDIEMIIELAQYARVNTQVDTTA